MYAICFDYKTTYYYQKTHHVVDFFIANPKTATKNTPTTVDVLKFANI